MKKLSTILISLIALTLTGCIYIECKETAQGKSYQLQGIIVKNDNKRVEMVEAKKDFQQTYAYDSEKGFSCDLSFFEISLVGADTDSISVKGNISVFADSQQRADKLLEETSFKSETANDILSLTLATSKLEQESVLGSLTITLPREIAVDIKTSNRKVQVKNIAGNCHIDNSRGEVIVSDIKGSLAVSTSTGQVRVENVQGENITLKTSYNPIVINNCVGVLRVNNERGQVKVENCLSGKGLEDLSPVVIKSSVGEVTLKEVQSSKIQVSTSYNPIRIDDSTGELEAVNERGGIFVNNLICASSKVAAPGKLSAKTSVAEVHITNVRTKSMEVKTSYNLVKIENCSGELKVNNERGGIELTNYPQASVSDDDLEKVWLHTSVAELKLENVRAIELDLKSSYNPIRVKNCIGKLTVSNERGGIYVSDFPQKSVPDDKLEKLSLRTTVGEIKLNNVRAPEIDLQTSYNPISVTDCIGDIKAVNERGAIKVDGLACASAELKTSVGQIDFSGDKIKEDFKGVFEASYNPINLTNMKQFTGSIDIEVEYGKINSDLPVAVELLGEISPNHITGKIGDGKGTLKVKNSRGSVSLK